MPIEPASETERSQDGEARFPSSELEAGCRKRASGEMARATPTHQTVCRQNLLLQELQILGRLLAPKALQSTQRLLNLLLHELQIRGA